MGHCTLPMRYNTLINWFFLELHIYHIINIKIELSLLPGLKATRLVMAARGQVHGAIQTFLEIKFNFVNG